MTDKQFGTLETKVSYGIGRQMGEQLLSNPFAGLSAEAVVAGLADVLAGRASQVADEQLQAAFQEMSRRLREQQQAEARSAAAEGEAYLAANAERAGVICTESGLQYEVLVAGSGARPARDSTVRTHYQGTLIDGTVFDSSYQRGQPAEFPVGGVIAGWTEALQLMPVGAKWRLHIPHQLAYGERGAGAAIQPYAALVFEVELLDILS